VSLLLSKSLARIARTVQKVYQRPETVVFWWGRWFNIHLFLKEAVVGRKRKLTLISSASDEWSGIPALTFPAFPDPPAPALPAPAPAPPPPAPQPQPQPRLQPLHPSGSSSEGGAVAVQNCKVFVFMGAVAF